MKKLIRLILMMGVLAALSYVVWMGVRKQQEKSAVTATPGASAAPAEEEKPMEYVVMLEKKKARALAIEKDQPVKMELQPRRVAFGSVLDPSPLLTLDGELAAAEAALGASKADHERMELLATTNDASRKNAEAAAAQFLADQIKVDGLVRGAQLHWGPIFHRDAAQRRASMEDLVNGREALLRVDLMPGDALAELPKSARILVLGREEQAITTTEILPATAEDPKTQAQGFLLRVNRPPFSLRPGMALTAWMELPEKPRPGYAVPRSAVLRHDGRAWVYVQAEEEKYVRTPVTLDTPLDQEKGWFIAENGGLSAEDVIVVTGVASLLSEEFKAQGGGED